MVKTILSTGAIGWSSPAILSSECKIKVSHFPFDKQHCFLEFGSWTDHGERQDVNLQLPYIDMESFSPNEEWYLYNNKATRRVHKYNCCAEPYPSVVFSIFIKRRAMFYLLNLIIPCAMITVVSLFSFILPPNSGERVSFVITVLLALSVYMMIVTETMPHSADTPLASKFFLFVMVEQSISLVATCFVIKFHNNAEPMPKWLDVLVHKLARLLCVHDKAKNSAAKEAEKDQLFVKRFENNGFYKDEDDIFEPKEVKKNPEDVKDGLQEKNHSAKTNEEFDKLVKEFKVLSDKVRDINAQEKVQDEWSFAAHVLDRFFLLSLLLTTFVAFLSIFLSIPSDVVLS